MEEEIARLRQRVVEAEARAAQEQRRREDEQRRREDEQRRREDEQRRREDEQRRREEAEQAAEDALPTDLGRYLEDCHKLWRAVDVVTDQALTTRGPVTHPTGRLYPKRIIPWENFVTRQQNVWEKLSSSSFGSSRVFPSSHYLNQVRSELDPISCETGLGHVARDIVEKAVQRLVQEVYQNPALQGRLNLRGTLTFQSHTNLGQPTDETIEEEMQQVSVRSRSSSVGHGSQRQGSRGRGEAPATSRPGKASRAASSRPAGQRAKGGQADQFCIYRQAGGQRTSVAAIEHKAPHKLTQEMIVTGLTGEIAPDRDIINRDDESVEYLSKRLMAAVVTQCFSYMIHNSLRDGYIFTGEAVVFLHIPEDPRTVYYYICLPSLDVSEDEDDDDRLHRTAVAQVFAFLLHALAAKPPSQAWHEATAHLDVWAVEYIDILRKIPETDRKPGQPPSAYKPGKWKPFVRSPIRTRARCIQAADKTPKYDDSDDDQGESDSNQQSPTPPPRSARYQLRSTAGTRGDAGRSGASHSTTDASDTGSRASIEERLFCTHKCLLGLLHGGSLDQTCPNIGSHGEKHISQAQFLRLAKTQLAVDRGSDADCAPLYFEGSRGALFKVRLSSHGYTLVAKGMEDHHRQYLRHERDVYKHALQLQGTHIPVCLGKISLSRPHYYSSGVYMHMLFLSWAGKPLFEYINLDNRSAFQERITRALQGLHRQHVVHGDAELRNILYDEAADQVMMIDLERASMPKREPLANISSNRKRKRGMEEKPPDDSFAREMRALKGYMSRAVR